MSSENKSDTGRTMKQKIGIAFRLCVDVVATLLLLNFLYVVVGINLHVLHNGYTWTIQATAHGFVNVFVALWHLSPVAVLSAVFHNLVNWNTFTFVVDTAMLTVFTFIAYVLWRNWWLGGSMLVLCCASLVWFVGMWAFQLLGPLFIPLLLTVGIVGVVVKGVIWATKKLWKLAEDDDH